VYQKDQKSALKALIASNAANSIQIQSFQMSISPTARKLITRTTQIDKKNMHQSL
jgi:hypothetical protein